MTQLPPYKCTACNHIRLSHVLQFYETRQILAFPRIYLPVRRPFPPWYSGKEDMRVGKAGVLTVACVVAFGLYAGLQPYLLAWHPATKASRKPVELCTDMTDELGCRRSWKGCTWVRYCSISLGIALHFSFPPFFSLSFFHPLPSPSSHTFALACTFHAHRFAKRRRAQQPPVIHAA